jgi:hypothetical protein
LNSGTSSIAGDIGISPGTESLITGFNLTPDISGTFATSTQVAGRVYAANYQIPTPTRMSTAVGHMQSAYLDASTRTPADFTGLYGGDLTGHTLAPGLYKWNSSVLIFAGGVTLTGGPDDVWIFQVVQDLTVAPQGVVRLAGGAKPSNIFWQVTGKTTLGAMSEMRGIILCAHEVFMNSDAILVGRALSQDTVSLDASTLLLTDAIFVDSFE